MGFYDRRFRATVLDKLDQIDRRLKKMATDQATFDQALTEFLADLDTGMQAIQAKLDAAGADIDLTAELEQVQAAKQKFDDQVAADTA